MEEELQHHRVVGDVGGGPVDHRQELVVQIVEVRERQGTATAARFVSNLPKGQKHEILIIIII